MECPRGSCCEETTHQVTTITTATEWLPGVTKEMLPITITSQIAIGGRRHVKIHDNKNNLIATRG